MLRVATRAANVETSAASGGSKREKQQRGRARGKKKKKEKTRAKRRGDRKLPRKVKKKEIRGAEDQKTEASKAWEEAGSGRGQCEQRRR